MTLPALDVPSQAGKLTVITGVAGLGFETGLALARAGSTVIMAGRNPAKGAERVSRLRASAPAADVTFELLDLASLASVRAFAERLTTAGRPIDILVNNAGIMMPPARILTSDGFESQIGINHLGHFALTGRLLPLLKAASAPRVVTMSSGAHLKAQINLDDLQSGKSYKPFKAYGQSKLANVLFTRELQRKSDAVGWGLLSVAVHPGYARTELLANGPKWYTPFGLAKKVLDIIGQDAADGSQSSVLAATGPDIVPMGYYGPKGGLKGIPIASEIGSVAKDDALAARLWTASEKLVGVHYQ